MVRDTGCLLRRRKVAAGRLEEMQDGIIRERWRVGHVHDNLRPGKCLAQAFACQRIHAGLRRRGNDFMALPGKPGDDLAADQASTSNHNDLHHAPRFWWKGWASNPCPMLGEGVQ
ncbi:hypothetical protein D3C86_1791860 [compost metagenome]